MHTSTPSFPTDAKFAELLKARNPDILIGMVGAKVAVDPEGSLQASRGDRFRRAARNSTTPARKSPRAAVRQTSTASATAGRTAAIEHNPARPMIENMDDAALRGAVYKRDLNIDNYFIGYLKHPYVSIYTGRGCRSKCTFCLWPQTVGGHRYRVRSPENVLDEVKWIKENMPEVKEIMFDDDTFTDFRPRAEEIARGLGKLGVTWSCNAKANVPYSTLKIMKDNGLRLLLVGYESGDDQILHNIKKGLRTDIARRFTEDCRKLGITIHGTFILGLPGETRETIDKTIAFAKEINPHTIQVSLAAPYPGTRLYEQAVENGWLAPNKTIHLVNESGVQLAAISYPHLSQEEIYHGVETFYKSFYFRPSKIWEIVQRNAGQLGHDEAAPARRRRVLPLPARARGLSCSAGMPACARSEHAKARSPPGPDHHRRRFRPARSVNQAVERAHPRRRAECRQPDGRRAGRGGRRRACARLPELARRPAPGAGRWPRRCCRRARFPTWSTPHGRFGDSAWCATACAFSSCPACGASSPPKSAPSSRPSPQPACRSITSTRTSTFICIRRCCR